MDVEQHASHESGDSYRTREPNPQAAQHEAKRASDEREHRVTRRWPASFLVDPRGESGKKDRVSSE